MNSNAKMLYGVIHIGSTALSMRIVSYHNLDDIQVIEEVAKEVTFGEEVYLNKKLSFASVNRLCSMLNGLKQLLNDYQVKEYSVYATAVFREAENKRAILDLIHVNTGFDVQVLDMSQEIYLEHFALQHQLRKYNHKNSHSLGSDFMFVDITSGAMGLTVWQGGVLTYQHDIHVGTLRLLETFSANQRASRDYPDALAEYIHAVMRPVWKTIEQYHPSTLVFSGRESRIIARLLGWPVIKHNMAICSPEKINSLYDAVGRQSSSHIRQAYGITEAEADVVLPTIHIYREILEHVPANKVVMMGTTFLESLSMYYGAGKTDDQAIVEMQIQNLKLTESIAEGYYYEPKHEHCMQNYSHIIIDAFRSVNGLGKREEFLLSMALILSQIGKYVNLIDSSRNTWSLIRSIDIFGISEKEKDAVACIAFYEHKGMPEEDDYAFKLLDDSMKMTVLKLIAVFRLVRAMDISRKQKIQDVTARMVDDTLLIEYDTSARTALESWFFEKENDLFKSVFGIEAKLERR